MKLTEPQRDLLKRVANRSLPDGTGDGLYLCGPYDLRVGNNLHRLGLVNVGVTYYAKITDLGRQALESR